MIHLENIDQLLSKTQIARSDKYKMWFEPYYPFKVPV